MHFIIVVSYQLILHIWEVWALQLHYFPQYCRFYVFDPPSAWLLVPYLTFQGYWGQISTWERNAFHYSCDIPTYTTYWRGLSTPTALFSSIFPILYFWPPFIYVFWPFLTKKDNYSHFCWYEGYILYETLIEKWVLRLKCGDNQLHTTSGSGDMKILLN